MVEGRRKIMTISFSSVDFADEIRNKHHQNTIHKRYALKYFAQSYPFLYYTFCCSDKYNLWDVTLCNMAEDYDVLDEYTASIFRMKIKTGKQYVGQQAKVSLPLICYCFLL
jgi:hypothetical protein